MTDPGQVVVRPGRLGSSLILAATGLVLVGVLAALWISLGSDGWSVWRGWLWSALTWVVLLPLALGLSLALAVLGREVLHPRTVVVSDRGYRRERGGRVELDLPVADLTGVALLPSIRIELRSAATTATLTENRQWREVVDVVRRWTHQRPDLLADEPTRALLADHATPTSTGGPLPRWPLGMIALAVRTRDPWAPFLPDDHGQHSRMFSRRFAPVRARERGATGGIVARWLFVGLWSLPFVVAAVVLVRLLLLAV